MQKGRDEQAKRSITENAITQAIDNAQVVVPRSMIDLEVKRFVDRVAQQAKQYQMELDMFIQISGFTREQFDKQAEEQSLRTIMQSLVVEQVAVVEKFDATTEEIDKRYTELSAHYGMPVEEIKKYVTEQAVKNDVTFEKAVSLIVDSAVLK